MSRAETKISAAVVIQRAQPSRSPTKFARAAGRRTSKHSFISAWFHRITDVFPHQILSRKFVQSPVIPWVVMHATSPPARFSAFLNFTSDISKSRCAALLKTTYKTRFF